MRSHIYAVAFAGALSMLGARDAAAQWSGPFVGAELTRSIDNVATTETTAATGAVFHGFNPSGGGFGGGVDLGYDWQAGRFVVGALAGLDRLGNGAWARAAHERRLCRAP